MWIVFAILVVVAYFYFKSTLGRDSSPKTNNDNRGASIKRRSSYYQSNKNYGRYSNNNTVVSLIDKNEELIRLAISGEKKVSFNYSDKEKNLTQRTVSPIRLFTYQFDDDGEMLCLEAFCFLRNANRTFALFRMSRIEVI